MAFVVYDRDVVLWDPVADRIVDSRRSGLAPVAIPFELLEQEDMVRAGHAGADRVVATRHGLAFGTLLLTRSGWAPPIDRNATTVAPTFDRWAHFGGSGSRLVLGSDRGETSVRLVEPRTYAVFSPDGDRIAAASSSGVEVRDAHRGRLLVEIRTPAAGGCAFSDDGRTLVAYEGEHGSPRRPALFDVSSGDEVPVPWPPCVSAVHADARGLVAATDCSSPSLTTVFRTVGPEATIGTFPGTAGTRPRIVGDLLVLDGPDGAIVEIATGRRTTTSHLHASQVAEDGRRIVVERGQVLILDREGGVAAAMSFPRRIATWRWCEGGTAATLFESTNASCRSGFPRRRADGGAEIDGAAVFARLPGESVVVRNGAFGARLTSDVGLVPCHGSRPVLRRCSVELSPDGRFALVSHTRGVRAYDSATGESLGSFRHAGGPFALDVSDTSDFVRIVPWEPGGPHAVLRLPDLAMVRSLPATSAMTWTWIGGWLVEHDAETMRFVGGGSPDGTPDLEGTGPLPERLAGHLVVRDRGDTTLVLRERDLELEALVPGTLVCTGERELVACRGGHAIVAALDADPIEVETTVAGCPRSCDDVLGTRAFVVGEAADGTLTLSRRTDGASIDVVIVEQGSQLQVVGLEDDGITGDHPELALLRRRALTSDGMEPARITRPTLFGWLAGP